MNKEAKRVMGLTIGAHGLVHLFEGVLPPLIPLLVTEFRTDYFHLGLVVTVFSYGFGLGALPAGLLADRLGPRRLVSVYLLGAGLISLWVWPTRSLVAYGAIMGLVGLCCSLYHPASNTLLSLVMPDKGRAFGLHGIAGSLGVASVPVLSAWVGSCWGWRAPHVLYGSLAVLLGLYSLRIPDPRRGPPPGNGEAGGASLDRRAVVTLVVFFLSSISLGMTYKGIMTFLPVYLGTRVRLPFLHWNTVTLGGTITTFALLSGAAGQYVAGRLADRHRPERLYLAAAATGMVFVLLMAVSTDLLLLAWTVLYAFFYFANQPIQNLLISRYFPPHRRGLGYGLHFLLSFGVGSTAAALCGGLADRLGLQAVFFAMAGCFLLAVCMILVLMRRVPYRQAR